jgi:hypothetical protein
MALSKIQSESVNLADDFAFTGTVTGAAPENSVAVICDAKSSSTTGGTFTSGAWRVRDLNTEVSNYIWRTRFQSSHSSNSIIQLYR